MADPTIRLGSTGSAVASLQQGLNLFEGFDFPVTGQFDSTTYAAVVRFQQIVGLQADGVCGPETWNALRSAISNLQSQQQVPPPVVPADPGTDPVTPGDSPPVIDMPPVDVVATKAGSGLMWLGLAALGCLVYWQTKKKRDRAGPGKPMLAAATEHDEDEPSEEAATWEERARAKRKRMRRSELHFGPESAKKPSGGTVMKNVNRKPTFKVRSEESARQVPYTSKGRSGSHSRGGDNPTDTRKVNEDLWMTQRRGAERSTQPYKHRVEEGLYNTDPARFRKWAQQKADDEGRTVIVVGQKSARVLYKYSPGDPGPRYNGRKITRRKLSDAVTDTLIEEAAKVAAGGTVADCEKAAKLLLKRKSLPRTEGERVRQSRVVRDVAASCGHGIEGDPRAEAMARVVETAIERQEELEEDMPPMQSRMKKGQSAQMTIMTDLLDKIAHRDEGRRTQDASYIMRIKGRRTRITKQKDASRKTGYRMRRTELPEQEKHSWRAPGSGRPTIPEEQSRHGGRAWRKASWFGPREGPRRPSKGN